MVNIISTKQINNDNKQHQEERKDHPTDIKHHRRTQAVPAPAKGLVVFVILLIGFFHECYYYRVSPHRALTPTGVLVNR